MGSEPTALEHSETCADDCASADCCIAFESLLSSMAARLVMARYQDIPPEINAGLAELRDFFKADQVTLLECRRKDGELRSLYWALTPGTVPPVETASPDVMPWCTEELRRGRPVRLASVLDDLPPEATGERQISIDTGLKSNLTVPFDIGSGTLYVLAMSSFSEYRKWSDALVERLRLAGRIIASALMRGKAQKNIERAKQEWEATFDAVPDLISIMDINHRIVRVNQSLAERIGREPGDLVGKRCHDIMHDRCAPLSDCPLKAMLNGGGERAVEAHEDHLGGDFLISVSPLLDADGELWGAVHVARDITELKRVQAELIYAREELEKRVQERTAELASSVDALRIEIAHRIRAEKEATQRRNDLARMGRVNALGELAAALAHELNQPLTAVVSNAQAAIRFAKGRPPDLTEIQETLVDIADDGKRAGEIIARLRSMVSQGETPRESLDINGLVQEGLEFVEGHTAACGVLIATELGSGLPPVTGSRVQILQVLLNLMMNGVDSMQGVGDVDPVLTVRTQIEGDQAVSVCVLDCGPGIDETQVDHLFNALFTTKENGLGMGLSICRTIVEAHRGTLKAENVSVGGACFSFTLPVSTTDEGDG